MNNESPANIVPGTIIASRYEVIKELGFGAMGDVYMCKHKDLGDKLFVIKVLKPEIANNESIVVRFNNEVIAALDVSHENVIRAYEFIKEDGLVAYTMEYIAGGDLADKMEEIREFPIPTVMNYLKQMALGTRALHQKGIIHRDLKPENILIGEKDVLKISDFGISVFDRQSRMTETGALLGSTNYIAPEYIERQVVKPQIDVYAMGVIVYEMATGSDPFPGDNIYVKMKQRTKYNPYDPRMFRKDLPEGISELILQMIAKDPKDRFKDCDELLAAIELIDAKTGKKLSKSKSKKKKKGSNGFEITKQKERDDEIKSELDENVHVAYKSELIDLSDRKLDDHNPYKTTAIVRSNRKKINWSLILPTLAILSIFGAAFYYVNFYKPFTKESRVDLEELDTLLNAPIENDSQLKDLANEYLILQEVDKMLLEGKFVFKENAFSDVNLTITPPVSSDRSNPQLRKVTTQNILLNRSDKFNFTVMTEAIAEIIHKKKLIKKKTKLKLIGTIDDRDGTFSIQFIMPDNFVTQSTEKSFGVSSIGESYRPFCYGKFFVGSENEFDI